MEIPRRLTSIVGESGCGKSTLVQLISDMTKGDSGSIRIGDVEVRDFSESCLMSRILTVTHNSHIFKGSVR
jgi:ABC-type transport system involved in cytochrome bd biosynthesis fused ATPase/permease subunit